MQQSAGEVKFEKQSTGLYTVSVKGTITPYDEYSAEWRFTPLTQKMADQIRGSENYKKVREYQMKQLKATRMADIQQIEDEEARRKEISRQMLEQMDASEASEISDIKVKLKRLTLSLLLDPVEGTDAKEILSEDFEIWVQQLLMRKLNDHLKL